MVGFAAAKGKTIAYVIPEEGAMVFMDTVTIPKGAPHLDEAYKLVGRSVSAEGQKVIADKLTQAVVNKAALPLVDAKNREIYQYGNLKKLFEKARFYPFWPLEADGNNVIFDQVLEEYQRFLKA
jgi:spermidine/putrescine-binding protein